MAVSAVTSKPTAARPPRWSCPRRCVWRSASRTTSSSGRCRRSSAPRGPAASATARSSWCPSRRSTGSAPARKTKPRSLPSPDLQLDLNRDFHAVRPAGAEDLLQLVLSEGEDPHQLRRDEPVVHVAPAGDVVVHPVLDHRAAGIRREEVDVLPVPVRPAALLVPEAHAGLPRRDLALPLERDAAQAQAILDSRALPHLDSRRQQAE